MIVLANSRLMVNTEARVTTKARSTCAHDYWRREGSGDPRKKLSKENRKMPPNSFAQPRVHLHLQPHLLLPHRGRGLRNILGLYFATSRILDWSLIDNDLHRGRSIQSASFASVHGPSRLLRSPLIDVLRLIRAFPCLFTLR